MSEYDVLFSESVFGMGQTETLPPPRDERLNLDVLEVSDVVAPSREFIESVRRFGIVTPVVVFDDGTRLRVADGRRRIAAAKALELQSVPAIVYAANSFIPDVLAMVLNEQRRDNPVADFNAIQRLQQRGATERDISAITGMSISRIRRRMALAQMHPDLFDALSHGTLSVTVAEACAKLPPAQQHTLVEVLQQNGRVTRSDIQDARTARKTVAVDALALDGLGELLTATVMPASFAEIVAGLSSTTLHCILAELSPEPRFDGTRQMIERQLASTQRIPVPVERFTRASAPVDMHRA